MFANTQNPARYVDITSETYTNYEGSCGYMHSIYDIIHPYNFLLYRGVQNAENIITFHFINSIAEFNAYGIETPKSPIQGCYWSYSTEWYLEASNDNQNWTELDHITGNILSVKGTLHEFQLSKSYSFPFVRFRSLKQDREQSYFGISRIEFFGTLTPTKGSIINYETMCYDLKLRFNDIFRRSFYFLYIT